MYYVIYGFLWLVSLLPLTILYVFADIVYGFVFYVFKYRVDVVMNNLAIAFPEKTVVERRKIAKKFYHNLIDTFIESLKFVSISKKQIHRRSKGDFKMVDEMIAKGYNVHLMAGHQFNWEFGHQLYAMHTSIPYIGIYMPITNKSLDKIFFNFRKKNGAIMISAKDFRNKVHQIFSKQYAIGLAADQNPGDPRNAYWMNFFGKPAPFVTGPAKGAVKKNTAVMIFAFKKIKRGGYEFTPKLLTENGSIFTPQQLTVMYKNALEDIIRQDPSNYLWSHRRWKWDWKPEYGPIID